MSAPTNHWKLGLFVLSGFALILATIAWLGARSLQRDTDQYVSYFDESVQGLEVGSPIKFRGVTVGAVGKIDIARDHRHVEVTSELGVAELARLGLDVANEPQAADRPKKFEQGLGLRVQLASAGLTGVKFLQLDFFPVADNPEPTLPFPVPNNYIPAVPSTIKNVEDALLRVVARLPELVDQVANVVAKVDAMVSGFHDADLVTRLVTLLNNVNAVLAEAQGKVAGLDTRKLSRETSKALVGLTDTVTRLNGLLAKVDGEKGLLASATRASDALGDTVRGADAVGGQLESTLTAVEKAAKSIQKLANALEKDPDMLLKGRSRAVEANR